MEEAKIKGHSEYDRFLTDATLRLLRKNQKAVFVFTFDGHIHMKSAYNSEKGAMLTARIERAIRQMMEEDLER